MNQLITAKPSRPEVHRDKGAVYAALSFALFLAMGSQPSVAGESDAFFERLVQHVETQADVEPKAKALILQILNERQEDADPELLLIESLMLMSPDFRVGIDAYDEEDYDACHDALEKIRGSDNPYLHHNAVSYSAKALVQLNRLIEARELIEGIKADFEDFKEHALDAAEMEYLLGYCEIQTLQYEQGRETLERFLIEYPDAPQRFIVTAKQMLAEVARVIPDSIGEVTDLMKFSGRRLAAADVTQPVHQTQDRIIELLEQLIDQAEQQEQQSQSSSNPSQSKNRRQQRKQQQQPNQPMPDSKLDQQHAQDATKRPGRQVRPGQAWGSMPDAQREKILQVLRDSFPGRYRALVEQYYETLAEEP